MSNERFHLTRGGEILAILHVDGRSLVPERDEYMTEEASYETTVAFETVRHLFEREIEIIQDEEHDEEWCDIWEELKSPGLYVESPDGLDRWDIMGIHFQNERAWWWRLYASPDTILRSRNQ